MSILEPYRINFFFSLLLVVLGGLGCASLLFAPLETLLPVGAQIPRIAFVVQPLVLTMSCVALGLWAAPKANLQAPVIFAISTGQNVIIPIRRQLFPALTVSVVVAGILIFYGYLTKDLLEAVRNQEATRALAFETPLISKVLFGGVSEELIARWGLMSVAVVGFLWSGFKRGVAVWLGCSVAALLFGVGHLPFLFALLGSPPLWLISTVIVLNAIPGLLFGYLFSSRGLECAMSAHGVSHILSAISIAITAPT